MNIYFLPGSGIFGGIKTAVQFVDALADLGVKILIATPDQEAPSWFVGRAPIVDRNDAFATLTEDDVAVFSLPHDYPVLRETKARLVFHCQGTDPLIDPILRDERVDILTCWAQAEDYAKSFGRKPVDVGICVSDKFFYDGTRKYRDRVTYMPRRGAKIAEACAAALPQMRFTPIEGAHELHVAAALKRAGYFLATSEGEWFGLPALEAMAAGCIVASVPVLGGIEYLIDGRSCRVASAAELPYLLAYLSGDDAAAERMRLLAGARVLAARYHPSVYRRTVETALEGRLKGMLSWS